MEGGRLGRSCRLGHTRDGVGRRRYVRHLELRKERKLGGLKRFCCTRHMLYEGQQQDPRLKCSPGDPMVLVSRMEEDLDSLFLQGTCIVVVNGSTCRRSALAYL